MPAFSAYKPPTSDIIVFVDIEGGVRKDISEASKVPLFCLYKDGRLLYSTIGEDNLTFLMEAKLDSDGIDRVKSFFSSFEEWNDIYLSCVVNPDDADSKYNLYIFDVNGNEGHIVVSTDNQITPILAYSFDCPFNLDNMSPGQASYIGYYSAANDYAVKNYVEQGFAEANRAEWEYLITFEPYSRATRDVVTSPILLDGIQWSQEWPYNSMCPSVTGGDASYNGHAPVGPTAMAICQIMKYWNWPFTGSGSYTHSSNANGGHGNITVNFGNETYGWYSILDTRVLSCRSCP